MSSMHGMRVAFCLLVLAVTTSCSPGFGRSPAKPYQAPVGAPGAMLNLWVDEAGAELSTAVYDNDDARCGGNAGYMGYRKSTGSSDLVIPANRPIQLSPMYSLGGAYCMDFTRFSLTAVEGRQYRLRYLRKREACEPDYNAKPDDRLACQPWAPFRETCTAFLEESEGSAWVPARGARFYRGRDPSCPARG